MTKEMEQHLQDEGEIAVKTIYEDMPSSYDEFVECMVNAISAGYRYCENFAKCRDGIINGTIK